MGDAVLSALIDLTLQTNETLVGLFLIILVADWDHTEPKMHNGGSPLQGSRMEALEG